MELDGHHPKVLFCLLLWKSLLKEVWEGLIMFAIFIIVEQKHLMESMSSLPEQIILSRVLEFMWHHILIHPKKLRQHIVCWIVDLLGTTTQYLTRDEHLEWSTPNPCHHFWHCIEIRSSNCLEPTVQPFPGTCSKQRNLTKSDWL